MTEHRYRLLNVFAGDGFSGNLGCMFEDGRNMDGITMQALALQFNLSEATFILPSERVKEQDPHWAVANAVRLASDPESAAASDPG